MVRYAIRRVLLALPTLLITALVVFILIRLVPGDPAQVMLGDIEQPAALARMRHDMALDQPIFIQFTVWLSEVFQGDFGRSIIQDRPVAEMLLPAFGVTATLVVPAVILAVLIAIPAGTLAACKRGRLSDLVVVAASTICLSIPSFWLGLIFLLIFGVKLNLLPVIGYVSPIEDLRGGLTYLIMPVVSLGLIEAGVLVRMVRSSTIDVLNLDYVTHARAKGLTELKVVRRHVIRNSLAPTWALIGLTLGALLGGAVVTESVFSIPGLGKLMVESIFARDYPVIQGCMLLITAVYVLVNLVIEVTYLRLDPGASLG